MVVPMRNDRAFVRVVLNSSLMLMSILIVVITIVAVEYRELQNDPVLADPLRASVVGTTMAAVAAGVLSLIALVSLRLGRGGGTLLAWGFGALICAAIVGIAYIATALMAGGAEYP